MSKLKNFSFPDGWTKLDELLEKLPRHYGKSSAIRLAVEEKLERVIKNPISLDDFKNEIPVPRLDVDSKTWNNLMKPMDTTELRKLQKQIQTKLNIVSDEIYRRTL